eukprot:COSAG01_NODE_61548_length_289_cov_0.542105_1_plen_23_part_10
MGYLPASAAPPTFSVRSALQRLP